MTLWPDVIGGGAMSLIVGDAPSRGPIYPQSSADFAAVTGLTLSSLYVFDEASGALDDKAGTADLAAAGTPTYDYSANGRRGVYYDPGDSPRNAADVNAVGLSSFLAFAVYKRIVAAGNYCGITARTNAGNAEMWGEYCDGVTDTKVWFDVRDSGTNVLQLLSGVTTDAEDLYIASLQVDRAATTMRARIGKYGAAHEALSGSIAGFATLDGASQVFGFGQYPGLSPGAAVFYGGILIGASAEGASKLADLHRALRWEK